MIPIQFTTYKHFIEIGEWLEQRFPNPPLPEEQRWTVIRLNDGSGRWGVTFKDEKDAATFGLKWMDKI